MTRKIIVRTEKGKSDSLRKGVKVVFTFTPATSNPAACSYEPIARGEMLFSANSEGHYELVWDSILAFGRYAIRPENGRAPHRERGGVWEVAAGQSYTINLLPSSSDLVWRPSQSDQPVHPDMIEVTNKTGEMQEVAMYLKHSHGPFYPIAALHPLENDEKILTSSDLLIQAYVLDGEGNYGGEILTPERQTNPLFALPIPWSDLPDSVVWRIHQDPNGTVRLKNDDKPDPDFYSLNTMNKSIRDIQGQLLDVLKSLGDTQERLALVEASAHSNKTELLEAQKTLTETRDQLRDLDRTVPTVDARATKLESLLVRTEKSVARVEKSVIGAHDELALGKKAMLDVQVQLSAVENVKTGISTMQEKVAGLDDRVPLLEANVDKLAKSLGTTLDFDPLPQNSPPNVQERLSALEVSVNYNRQHLAQIKTSFTTDHIRLLELSDQRIPAVEAKCDQAKDLISRSQGEVSTLRNSVGVARTRLTDLEGMVLLLEAKANKPMGSLNSEHPAVSKGERNVDEMTKILLATGAQLAGLDSRVTSVEVNGKELAEMVRQIHGLGTGDWPSSPSVASPWAFQGEIYETTPPLALESSIREPPRWGSASLLQDDDVSNIHQDLDADPES